MNYIEKQARKLVKEEFDRLEEADELLETAYKTLSKVDNKKDKLNYLAILLEGNNSAREIHLKDCPNKDDCYILDAHEKVHYFLLQELDKIGISLEEDAISNTEKESINTSLNEVLESLDNLEIGQQITYDDLMQEMEELKKWQVFGKKNWRQLAMEKTGEMVVGGVISEATAQPIIQFFKGLFGFH